MASIALCQQFWRNAIMPLAYISGTDVVSHLCSVLVNSAYTSFGEDSDFFTMIFFESVLLISGWRCSLYCGFSA